MSSESSRPSVTKQQEIVINRIHKYTLSTYKHAPYDYYKILDLDHNDRHNISQNDLKKTYRKLAINLHPDKNSHDKAPDCFKLINKVYEHLSDQQNKKSYDIDGIDYSNKKNSAPSGPSSFGARRGGAGQSPFFNQHSHNPFFQQNADFDELFNMFAGGGGGSFQTFQFDPFNGGFRRTNMGGAPRFRQQQQQQQEEVAEDGMVFLRAIAPILIVLLISILQRIFGI
ncbi:hypothetical protein ACO0OL_003682 [Hanseniaspora opuntiae]